MSEDDDTAVRADAEVHESHAVPGVQDDEHVAVSFEPQALTVEEIKTLIGDINDARRADEAHEHEAHYDDLHDELRSRRDT